MLLVIFDRWLGQKFTPITTRWLLLLRRQTPHTQAVATHMMAAVISRRKVGDRTERFRRLRNEQRKS